MLALDRDQPMKSQGLAALQDLQSNAYQACWPLLEGLLSQLRCK